MTCQHKPRNAHSTRGHLDQVRPSANALRDCPASRDTWSRHKVTAPADRWPVRSRLHGGHLGTAPMQTFRVDAHLGTHIKNPLSNCWRLPRGLRRDRCIFGLGKTRQSPNARMALTGRSQTPTRGRDEAPEILYYLPQPGLPCFYISRGMGCNNVTKAKIAQRPTTHRAWRNPHLPVSRMQRLLCF
jgi:hypothetical protein